MFGMTKQKLIGAVGLIEVLLSHQRLQPLCGRHIEQNLHPVPGVADALVVLVQTEYAEGEGLPYIVDHLVQPSG